MKSLTATVLVLHDGYWWEMVLHDGRYMLTPKQVLLTYHFLYCRDGYTPVMVALWFQRLEALRFFLKVVFHTKLFSLLLLLFHYLIEWYLFFHVYLHFDQYLKASFYIPIQNPKSPNQNPKNLNPKNSFQFKILKILIQQKTQGNVGHTRSLPQDAWDWRVYWGACRVWPFVHFNDKNLLNNVKLNKLAKLIRHASRVHFAKIHFG